MRNGTPALMHSSKICSSFLYFNHIFICTLPYCDICRQPSAFPRYHNSYNSKISAVLKCIFPQRNLIPRDSYYIEAAWYLCAAVLHQIINGRSGQAHLFGHRYRLQSSRKPSCFAKFHLTKDQIFSVFCNNVNLRITAAEIILQYPISLLFQKFTCYFFIFCTGPSPVFFILQSPFGSDLLPVLTDFYTKCPIKLLLWIGVGPSV